MELYYITYKGKKLLGPMTKLEAGLRIKSLIPLFINFEITTDTKYDASYGNDESGSLRGQDW